MLGLTTAGLVIRPVSPMGYCDHCALRKIAADQALSEKLVTALKAGGGTLAVSWLNLGEYATVTDREQRLEAELLLDRLLPHVFPINVDPGVVSKREHAGDPYPHADREIGALFVKKRTVTISASGIDLLLSASDLFEPVNHPILIRGKDRLARLTLRVLNQRRRDYATRTVFSKQVREAVRASEKAVTHTDAVVRTLAATLFPDQRRVLTLNDAIDFLHAAVPVAFCDAVLLDGAAWDTVERTRRNLPGIAKAFSIRGDGVERFLAYLSMPRRAGEK